MANLPFVGDISTKGALRGLHKDRTDKQMALARADITIARVRDFCPNFLRDAELMLEAGSVNPGEVCELIDRCYKGYHPRLLRSGLTALSQASSPATSQQILMRLDQLHHRAKAGDTRQPSVSRLLHPAGN